MKKKSSLSRLFEYAGNYKYLTVLSWILSAVSAWIALVPFYYIWRIIKEVLAVAPDYSQAQNLKGYGWAAVGFALLSMIIYVGSLMCSHVAAFHVQAEMRSQMMHHIVTLPMGFMDSEGSVFPIHALFLFCFRSFLHGKTASDVLCAGSCFF